MPVRGIRGATTAAADQPAAITEATRELLGAILAANPDLRPQDLASAQFTVTEDLSAAYPAAAARELGWTDVPLISRAGDPCPRRAAALHPGTAALEHRPSAISHPPRLPWRSRRPTPGRGRGGWIIC